MIRFYALLCSLFLFGLAAQAQVSVSGTVTDAESGEPLAGAVVMEKGTNNGTFTDEMGKYELDVPSKETLLLVRFTGYETVEIAGGGDVTLAVDALQMDDVVMTAFGVSRDKKALGYSVQEVDGQALNLARDANVVNNLSGRVAGVNIVGSSGNVGASSRIVIRGNSSITGNNQPLFVINGIPVDNGTNNTTNGGEDVDYGNVISDLNPEDIASVTVLKGPNAAALYGSRAANGVVLITTKKGTEMGGKPGLGVSYSMNVGFSNPFRLPNYQNKFGQGTGNQFGYYDGDYGGVWDGYDESWGPAFDATLNETDGIDNDVDGLIDEPGEGSSFPQYTGTWGVWDSDGFDNNYDGTVDEPGEEGYSAEPWVARPDNIKNLFQTGVTLTNNVAISANGERSYARFSYTNMNQTGMLPNTDYKRNSFDLSFGGKMSSKFSMDGNIKYIRSASDNRPGVGYAGDNVLQQSIWVGRQVDWEDLKENYETTDYWGNNYNWNHSYQNNPFFTLYNNVKPMDRDRVMGYYALNYDVTDWLKARGRIGTDFYRENRRRIFAVGTKDHPNGRVEDDLINLQETNMDFLLTATKRFGEDFDFSANLGGNRMMRGRRISTLEVPALVVPGVYNVSNSNGSPLVSDELTEKAINSLYGSVSMGYKGFVYLDITGRNDWSSTLPAENNSYFYPSVTASLLINEMVELPSMFDLLKVRAGWAAVGNDTDPYQLSATYASLDPWAGNPTFTVPNTLPAADLRPERTTSLETGLELVMFGNRLYADVTYYNALTTDQIIQIDVAPSTGATSQVTNAGSIRNSGIELMLRGALVQTKDFQWTLGVNWAKNKSEVVELADDVEAIRLGRYWALDLEARAGEPFGVFRGQTALRDDAGNLILSGGVPQLDPDGNDQVLGTITPDWTGGITTGVKYKGFSLNALVDMRKGSDLFSVTYMFGRYAGVLEESLEGRETVDEIQNGYVFEGVMEDADGNLVPNTVPIDAETYNAFFFYSLGGHDRSIFDASFIKLREVSLSYALPSSLFANNFIGGIEVGAYGRNLALLYSNVPHIDPETAFGSQIAVQGFEFGALPSARTFGFTLRANF